MSDSRISQRMAEVYDVHVHFRRMKLSIWLWIPRAIRLNITYV